MRIDNWDTKLANYVAKHAEGKFIRGKTDCVTFVVNAIELITGKKVFDTEYKTLKEAKEILKKLKKKNLFDIANDIAKENKFKKIDTAFAKRGDVVFLETDEELGGTMGICIGEQSIFRIRSGSLEKRQTNKCHHAWSIE
tara:strand:- start:44 stop:463 length:420 start_codon:yes stop_codon:yes gene_type:complete